MRRVMMAIALATLAGCDQPRGSTRPVVRSKTAVGEPRIDASSDATLRASIQRILNSLPETRRQEFREDCLVIMGSEHMKAAFVNTTSPDERKKGYKMALIYKSVDGLTAARIHDRAQEMRTAVEEDQKTEKLTQKHQEAKAKAQEPSALTEARKAQRERDAQQAQADANLAAKKSPEAVKNRAEAEIREGAPHRLGAEVATDAIIVADNVKPLGGDTWEVTGHLTGPAKTGGATVNWVVLIKFTLGHLQSANVYWGDRRLAASRDLAPASKNPPMSPGMKPGGKPKVKK